MMNTKSLLQFPADAGEFAPTNEPAGTETKTGPNAAKAGSTAKPEGHPNSEDSNLYLNNSSTFWLHATVHLSDFTATRLRLPLGTKDIEEARARRDLIFRFAREVEGFVASPSAHRKRAQPRHFKHAA
jgi:hypothetical protein